MINLTAEKKINTLRVKLALPSYIWKFDGKLLYEYKTPEGDLCSRSVAPIKQSQERNFYFTWDLLIPSLSLLDSLTLTVSVATPRGEALLGRWSYLNNQLRRENQVVPFPERMIGFSLTNQCNLQCSMCWQKNRSEALYLSFEDIKSVIEEAKLFGRPPIYFWGGEPFLHPRFWEIIRMVKENGFFCVVNTNGMIIKNTVEKILASGLDMIVVSIDGREQIHDRIRGRKGVYRQVISGLEKLLERRGKRPIVAVNSVITELNYKNMDDLVALKKILAFDYLDYQFLIYYSQHEKDNYKSRYKALFGVEPAAVDGYGTDFGEIDFDQLNLVIKKVKEDGDNRIRFFPYAINSSKDVYNYFNKPWNLGVKSCDSIRKSFWVEPNGDVIPCSIFPDYVVGNIKNDSFYSIWNNERFQKFRRHMDEGLFSICYRCCDLYKKDYI
mgnify:CR=1 FL=1